jgi:guanylate kinase
LGKSTAKPFVPSEMVSTINKRVTGTRGRLIILSAPSGAGKTSLAKALAESIANLKASISYTTRSPRESEKNDVDYFFVSRVVFERMIRANAFLEHADVFDHLYGTAQKPVEAALSVGQSIVLDIDWQGARKVRAVMSQVLSIFILPPSLDDLESRLIDRGQDSSEAINRRMDEAISEISHYTEFDYVIVNRDFTVALEELREIVLTCQTPQSSEGFDIETFLQSKKNARLKG